MINYWPNWHQIFPPLNYILFFIVFLPVPFIPSTPSSISPQPCNQLSHCWSMSMRVVLSLSLSLHLIPPSFPFAMWLCSSSHISIPHSESGLPLWRWPVKCHRSDGARSRPGFKKPCKIFIHSLKTLSTAQWTSLANLLENDKICRPELSQPSCSGQVR